MSFFGKRSLLGGLVKARSPAARLVLCTLNAVDDSVHPDVLVSMARQFDHAEFGVAYRSPEDGVGPRYASEDRIRLLANIPDLKGRLALHLCGDVAVRDFLAGKGFAAEIAPKFKRIQLNSDKGPAGGDLLERELLIWVTGQPRYQGITIIIPIAPDQVKRATALKDIPNVNYLHDMSGGKEQRPEIRPPAVPGCFTAYAGGIGLSNLEEELGKIHVAANGQDYGIDIESGVRRKEDDRFCPSKSLLILGRTKNFISKTVRFGAA